MLLLNCRASQAVKGMGGGMLQHFAGSSGGGSNNNSSSWGLSWKTHLVMEYCEIGTMQVWSDACCPALMMATLFVMQSTLLPAGSVRGPTASCWPAPPLNILLPPKSHMYFCPSTLCCVTLRCCWTGTTGGPAAGCVHGPGGSRLLQPCLGAVHCQGAVFGGGVPALDGRGAWGPEE
jgi:hypothetical protein